MKKILFAGLGLSVVAVAAWLLWPSLSAMFKPKGFVQPIPGAEPAFTTYEFNAEEGARLSHPTGSTITIPPNALVDEDGQPVRGKVQVNYRELHSVLDVVTSGVPLSYDSAGGQYHLQTAGMFDINAQQNQKPLAIAQGQQVNVRFASFEKGDDYSFYNWDHQKGTWVFLQPGGKAEPNAEKLKIQDSLNNIRLVEPEKLMGLHFGEALDVYVNYNYSKAADATMQRNFKRILDSYKLNMYEYLLINAPVKLGKSYYPAHTLVWKGPEKLALPQWLTVKHKASYTETTDTYYRIESDAKPLDSGNYQLTIRLIQKLRVLTEKTWQDTVWETNSRTKARRVKDIVSKTRKQWEEKSSKTRSYSFKAQPYMRLGEFFRKYKPKGGEALSEYEQAQKAMEQQGTRIDQMAEVYRTISISSFGTYNYDRMLNIPEALPIASDFKAGAEKPNLVYFINAKEKFVIEYPPSDWAEKVRINPNNSSVRIFAIMPDYTVAQFTAEQWAAMDWNKLREQKQFTFELRKDTDIVRSQADLKKALNM